MKPYAIFVFGLPGSGKSYFAEHLAQQLKAKYLSSDRLRRRLFPKPTYTREEKEQVYLSLAKDLKQSLQAGRSVVMDATFHRNWYREMFRHQAASAGAEIRWICITANESVIRKRVNRPRPWSDADWKVYLSIRGKWEDFQSPHLILSSSTEQVEEMLLRAAPYINKGISALENHLNGQNIPALISAQFGQVEKWIETHISWVGLTKEEAFKVKKPVNPGFLDFSHRYQRAHFCREELRLNRRFAPEIYLEVLPIWDGPDGLSFREGIELVDHAVRMKRLPEARRMERVIERKGLSDSMVKSLAATIADFHQSAEIMSEGETAEKLIPLFEELRGEEADLEALLGPGTTQRVEQMLKKTDKWLRRHAQKFARRVELELVRDVHGDLHTGNIFLTEPPTLFDCIEFRADFRQIDLLHEIAFLCMDLDALGNAPASQLLLKCYLSHPGTHPELFDRPLFLFYKCYMANVRAKVTAMRLHHASGDTERAELQEKCGRYLDLMERYLEEMEGAEGGS